MDNLKNDHIKKIITPIGEFTINSYDIPAGYTLYSSPSIISDSDDVYKIISLFRLKQTHTPLFFIRIACFQNRKLSIL